VILSGLAERVPPWDRFSYQQKFPRLALCAIYCICKLSPAESGLGRPMLVHVSKQARASPPGNASALAHAQVCLKMVRDFILRTGGEDFVVGPTSLPPVISYTEHCYILFLHTLVVQLIAVFFKKHISALYQNAESPRSSCCGSSCLCAEPRRPPIMYDFLGSHCRWCECREHMLTMMRRRN
jgi:hypothetical protein